MTNHWLRLAFFAGLCTFSCFPIASAQPFCAQPPFAELSSSPVPLGVNATQVVAVQADQDGFADLAWVKGDTIALEGAPTELWLALSDGAGGFQTPVKVGPLQVYASYLAVGDVNADSHEDLLILPYSGAAVKAAIGDGAGGFAVSADTFVGLAERPSFANLNGDQFPDLILPGLFSDAIRPFLGNGDGTFDPLDSVPAGFRPRFAATGDVNGDGIDDAAVPYFHFLQLRYSELGQPLGKSRLVAAAVEDPAGPNLFDIVGGSFNEDAHPDFASMTASYVHVWTSDGAGELTAAAYPIAGVNAVALRGADLNGDGLTDLLWMDADTKQWFVMPAKSDGSFDGVSSPITTPGLDRLIQTRDIDGDGQVDLIGAVFGTDEARIFRNTCPFLLTTAVTPDPGFSGEAIEYRFAITNAGDQSTAALQWALTTPAEINPLSATPSAGTCATAADCALGALDPGQSVEVTVDASLVTGFIGDTGPTATVSDPALGGHSWRAHHWAAPRVVPQLSIELTPRVAAVNLTVTARVSIRNDGSDSARNAILRLSAPPAQVGVLASSLGPQCAPTGPGETVCALGDIAPRTDSRTVELELRALAASASPVAIRADFTSDEGFTGSVEAPLEIVDFPPSSHSFKWRPLDGDPLNGFQASGAIRPPSDWNGDGNVDLIVGEVPLLGAGDGRFTRAPQLNPPVFFSVGLLSRLADLDGDGAVDLVGPNSARKGNGSGDFRDVLSEYDNALFYRGLAVADFNEDGRPDIAAGVDIPDCEVRIYMGAGDGTFAPGAVFPGCLYGSIVSDFNGDGHQDLITFVRDFSEPAVLHFGDGAGGFSAQVSSINVNSSVSHAAVADFDADGLLDVSLLLRPDGGPNVSRLFVFRGNGAGGFFPSTTPLTSIGSTIFQDFLPVADWDLDGLPEMALAGPILVDVLPGGVLQSRQIASLAPMTPLISADVNHDGAPDLIGEWQTPPAGSSRLAVLLNVNVAPSKLGVFVDGYWFLDRSGDFNFDPSAESYGWGSSGDIPVRGDWNGDGYLDLGVFHGGQWFLDRNGNRAFDPATEAIGWGEAGWTPAPGDWNGDGVTDLGVVAPDSAWFRDLNGDRVFDPATEIIGWGSPGDTPVVGDWNGDGKDDLGVFSGGIWFLDLDGNGQFDPASEIKGWGEAGWTPVTGDWNGDGETDIGAVAPNMTWFRDVNGDFAFNPATEQLVWGSAGASPVVGDWDADGDDDAGVFQNGLWRLFQVGDRYWGEAGWTPVPGVWR